MKRRITLLAAALLFGLTLAQDESEGDHHDDHAGHDHLAEGAGDGAKNLFDLGGDRFAILPLLSLDPDGYRGTLVLTLVAADTPQHHDHDGDEHAEASGDDEHGEHHEGEHEPGDLDPARVPRPTATLLDPDGTVVSLQALEPRSDGQLTAYALPWFSAAAAGSFDGVWRLTLGHADSQVEVPIAVASETTALSEVVTILAPAPSLSRAGLTEGFIYAFRQGRPVHAAMEVQRRMPGMQHSTDDEWVPLVHDHFPALAELVPRGGAMANRSPLNFAMAGTWELILGIAGDDAEAIPLSVQVLSD